MALKPRPRTTRAGYAARKSPEAFRSISEVSELLQMPQHVLRFWEIKFPHLRPLKRRGSRRYYRTSDIEMLHGIYSLLYDDRYSIEGVQRVFALNGARYVQEKGRKVLASLGGIGNIEGETRNAPSPSIVSQPERAAPAELLGALEDDKEWQAAKSEEATSPRQRALKALAELEAIAVAMQSSQDIEET